jgi:hypothetical protein
MTRAEIIKLAREIWGETAILPFYEIERFAALVAERERAECAKVCESIGARRDQYADPVGAGAADECAAAIRARSST